MEMLKSLVDLTVKGGIFMIPLAIIVLAAGTRGLIGRVLQECLLRIQAGETDVESATEKEILSEMGPMERSRGWLATMIQVAPPLGLIGTVQGMIQCFMTIERSATA